MRGKNYNKINKTRPVSEIWVDFKEPMLLNATGYKGGHKEIDGYISFGGETTPKEVGLALEDFGKFLQTLPEDSTYADYDEGDMCCG